LIEKVLETRADIGIALDGDADRVLIVDEKGAIVDGDQLMTLIGESWAKEGRLQGGGVVATVMSNLGMERHLADKGLELARTKVGDRYVVEHMRKHGFNLGGEQPGHIVMTDYATTGDGLVAALQILACVQKSDCPVSEVRQRFELVPPLLRNTKYSGGSPLERPDVKEAISDAEAEMGDSGRLVIRASGTEPLIRVMAEGDDAAQVEKIVDGLIDLISD
jgi:phosphoglucosamine mutase